MAIFIGIPTLNRPHYVRDAVGSLLAQTYQDFRVVVSDNASEPDAFDSVAEFIRSVGDPRIRLHRQGMNVGEYGQGRFFIRDAADEEFYMILHDDDVLKPEYLETAVRRLRENPDVTGFVARPAIVDVDLGFSAERTRWYLTAKQLVDRPAGPVQILTTLLECGFPRISGACFRTAAVRASGLVDDDCHGNFPFEFNVLLRLGERGAAVWYCPEPLINFRFHGGSMMHYIKLLDNPDVVSTMTTLLERRRFTGANERRRRAILGRLYRASAMIRVKTGEHQACRREITKSLWTNPRSWRSWALFPPTMVAPRLLRAALPPPPEVQFGPRFSAGARPGYRSEEAGTVVK